MSLAPSPLMKYGHQNPSLPAFSRASAPIGSVTTYQRSIAPSSGIPPRVSVATTAPVTSYTVHAPPATYIQQAPLSSHPLASSAVRSTQLYQLSPEEASTVNNKGSALASAAAASGTRNGKVPTGLIPSVPDAPVVTSGSAGTIIATQRPYSFTTVTYAKDQQPVRECRISRNLSDRGSSCSSADSYMRHGPKTRRKFVSKQRGSCGGCNEEAAGCFDSNGGVLGWLNCGCCDRKQKIPAAIDYSPEAY